MNFRSGIGHNSTGSSEGILINVSQRNNNKGLGPKAFRSYTLIDYFKMPMDEWQLLLKK